ncbi:MAG: hypothetical protein ASARMPREDX12_006684 [Alectoria sarmentosa]|nr:MAG: hypothetical protein ASARMPREDX12_006684 [Alectoria sarmentosa]
MGTLTDITARAGNTMKRQSTYSMGYQSLDSPTSAKRPAENENSVKSKSPHFMTPTFSSSLQSAAVNGKEHDRNDRNITPVPSKSTKAESSNTWMKSAAKRVGFHRTADGTPCSKKEGLPKNSKTVSFPDKLAAASYSRVLDTPPSTKMQPQKVSPTDKPLPNPPNGRIPNPSEFPESKTLIDASDKPLRRRSPPGMVVHEEDWPVLYPRRPTSPRTLQEMMRETGSQLTQQAVSSQKERYPVLGNTLRQVPGEEQLPVSRYSTMYKIPRKEVSSPNLGKLSSASKDTAAGHNHIDDPFKDGVYDSGPVVQAKSTRIGSESPSNLSAGAAAVEKSAQESRPAIEPRQTRTSSLRARLSAGQLIKDGQNKVVGFTDFTATPEPALGATRRDSLRARKEAQARRLTPPHPLRTNPSKEPIGGNRAQTSRSLTPPAKPVPHPLRTNPSRESIGANRAPAQFVAGSRRPTHPRRPSSRGSLRSEFRESTPPLPIAPSSRSAPNRPAPATPASRYQDTKHGKSSEKALVEVPASLRNSSIPVPRQVVSNMPRQPNANDKDEASDPKRFGVSAVKKEARDEFAIFEGHPSLDMVRDLDQTLSDSSPDMTMDLKQSYSAGHPSQALIDNYGAHILESIEESPQHAYKVKRLSTASPEFGPILKISPSAERFIMGPDSKTDRNPLSKKKSKELDRNMMKKDQKDRPDRPSSSQGLSRQGSRVGLIDTKIREKKVKSADLGRISPVIDHLLNGSHKLTSRLHHESTGASAKGSSTRTSFNDPFFDARSQLQASPEEGNDINGQERNATAEESSIIPLGENTGVSSDELPVTTGFLSIDSHIENGIQPDFKLCDKTSSPFEDTATAAGDFGKEPKTNGFHTDETQSNEASPHEDIAVATKDFGQEPKNKEDDASVIHLPSTPEQRPLQKLANSGSHPPRSSSRIAHLDFTTAKNSPVSPLSADKPPPTPPKDKPQDFAHRQNNLGSLRGHGTSQVDLSNHASKRDSTAHESSKSQASASKGSLSIFRGLFHKRSSENEPLKSGKKTKSKATVNPASGSPFPPISEVHPVHRPTLASIARSTASTPRPSTATRPATPATPSPFSPVPTETSTSTHLAMELLDLSRKERSSPKKEKLLQLGSVMVEGITQARNAEKAMEEAKQAARRAEVAHALCRKSLAEATRCVEMWRAGIE